MADQRRERVAQLHVEGVAAVAEAGGKIRAVDVGRNACQNGSEMAASLDVVAAGLWFISRTAPIM